MKIPPTQTYNAKPSLLNQRSIRERTSKGTLERKKKGKQNRQGRMSEKETKAVKAFVRIRPFTAKEMTSQPQPCIRPRGNVVFVEREVLAQAEADAGKPMSSPRSGRRATEKDKDNDRALGEDADGTPSMSQNHTFEFDGVFWSIPPNQILSEQETQDEYYISALPPFANQEQLFLEVGLSAVDSLMKGFPVTVFAYGQTGSGKSHTIFGPMTDPGLSPRMAIEIFKILEEERQYGWKAEVTVSCFEIYNEKVTDLLTKSAAASKPSPKGGRKRATSTTRLATSQRSFGTFSASPLEMDDLTNDGAASVRSYGSGLDSWTPSRAGGATPRTPRGGGVGEMYCSPSGGVATSQGDDRASPAPGDDESVGGASSANDCMSGTLEPSSGGNTSAYASPSPPRGYLEAEPRELKVRQHPDLGVFVEGLRKEQVGDAYQLTAAIHGALHHRVTAATKMNDTSSRSHAVIQVGVDIRDEVQGKRRSAIMNIIDLAGSERISRSGVTGQQLCEAKNINQSLTTLRRVIDVITEANDRKHKLKQKQIPPFRESTLTWILMDCFGGSSVTIMLATASPHIDNISDTISTMRYATKCKTIVNHVRANESKIAVTIAAINAESERLRKGLREVETSKADSATLLRQEKAKIVRKNNVIKAVIKPSHDRMRVERDKTEQLLKEATEAFHEVSAKVARRERKGNADAELAAIAHKNTHARVETEHEYRAYRRAEDEIQHYKAEINQLLNIAPTSNAGMFKSMRRTAIRRQIIMYAQEQRDKPAMERKHRDNEEMKRKLGEYEALYADLDARIEEERRNVDVAAEPERARNAATQRLNDAHEDIAQSIEGFRKDTGACNKQIAVLNKELQSLEDDSKRRDDEYRQWVCFHDEVVVQLHNTARDVAQTIRREATNVEELLVDLTDARRRRKEADEALVVTAESVRLAIEELAECSLNVGDLKGEVEGLAEESRSVQQCREELLKSKADALVTEEQLEKQAEAMTAAVKGLEHVIRSRCFPDASELYGDRVLARMALDLEAAASVSPKELQNLRRLQEAAFSTLPSSEEDSRYVRDAALDDEIEG